MCCHEPQGTTVKVEGFKRSGEAWFRIMENKSQIMQTRGLSMGNLKATEAMVEDLARRYVAGDIPRVALKKLKGEKEAEFSASAKRQAAAPNEAENPKKALKKRIPQDKGFPNKKTKPTTTTPAPAPAASSSSSSSEVLTFGGLFDNGVPLSFDEAFIQRPSEED